MSDKLLRPTYAKINLNALRRNFQKIKELSQTRIMPIVKANAYGHGAKEVAGILQAEGADILGVATIEEGVELRENAVTVPIVVLGSIYPLENFETVLEYNLTPVIASQYSAKIYEEIARKMNRKGLFHLKVDTGMGRIGVSPDTAIKLMDDFGNSEHVYCGGIFTHLACADENPGFTSEQLKRLNGILDRLEKKPEYIHAANTVGVINFPDARFNLVRPGLAIYGLYPGGVRRDAFDMEPVLCWHSRIVFLKEVRKGTPISYCGTWSAPVSSKIATVCVGYADGYQRALSNRAHVIIREKKCPVVGRVCMDMIMVDVTSIQGVSIGDEVILIGEGGSQRITAEDIAEWAQTINYEIVTGISGRVPRMFYES